MERPTLYTAAEVAEILRLNPQVVQRKLQAGEIPGYRIGREWRIDHGSLMSWLERHSNQQTKASRTIDAFFEPDGRLRSIPAQRKRREAVLERIAGEIQPDRVYPERELNAVLGRFHPDVASVRREMVGLKLLVRTRDGRYKKAGPREAALRRG